MVWLWGKESTYHFRRHRRGGFDLRVGSSPGGGNSNLLQYSFLQNLMDRGAWQATVCGGTKSWTKHSIAQYRDI